MKTAFRLGLILLLALVSLEPLHAKGLKLAPLFDFAQWQARMKILKTEEVQALQQLIAIHYDHFLGRPWEAQYPAEYKSRLENFKKFFCPEVKELCTVSSEVRGRQETYVVPSADILVKPSTIQQINIRLAQLKSHARLSLPVRFPGLIPPEEDQLAKYNLILGDFVAERGAKDITRVKHVLIGDMTSYYMGYMQKDTPNYFALDKNKHIYIIDESIKSLAVEVAIGTTAALNSQDVSSPLDTAKFLLQRYIRSKSREASFYATQISSQQAQELLAYQSLNNIVASLARQFQKLEYPYTANAFFGVILNLQKSDVETDLVRHILIRHSLMEDGPLINQFATKQLVNVVLRENLTLLIGHAPYESSAKTQAWSETFDTDLFLFRGNIETENPELHKLLIEKGLYDPQKWKEADLATRKKIMETTLFPISEKSGKFQVTETSQMGFYGLLSTLTRNAPQSTLQEMADTIIKIRLK